MICGVWFSPLGAKQLHFHFRDNFLECPGQFGTVLWATDNNHSRNRSDAVTWASPTSPSTLRHRGHAVLPGYPPALSSLAYWTGEINSGALSAAAVEQSIINSSEAQGYVVPIVEMYAILGRAPDQAGLNGWVHALEGGASLPGIALAFISSPEGQGIYGAVPTAASSAAVDTTFTADLYKEILGRAPDAGGLSCG